MAWVNLEDLTGTIELVLFPRTWEKYQFMLEVGGVILVEGKADAQSSPTKVLVDKITTEIKVVAPAEERASAPAPAGKPAPGQTAPQGKKPMPAAPRVAEPAPIYNTTHPADGEAEGWTEPPPPEDPPEWETYTPVAHFAEPDLVLHAADLPEEQKSGDSDQSVADERQSIPEHVLLEDSRPSALDPQSPPLRSGDVSQSSIVNPQSSIVIPPAPKFAPAVRPVDLADDHAPQMVTVILRPCGDAERDIRRIGRLHGTFISYPGKDRFQFHIFEDGKGHLIDFPNDTTHVCPELLEKLNQAVGEENVRIEPILYQ
jgi:DNA polymerase-3 subunit alpha